jgi:hypothetical protein
MIRISVPRSSRWVAKRHRLLDPGRLRRLVEQAVELARRHRPAWLASRKQPALLSSHALVVTPWAHRPPLPQKREHLWRQHDVTVLAALGLLDPDDALGAVDMLDLEANHLAGAQAAAIAETERHPHLDVPRRRQQPLGLVRAHDER